MQSIRVSFLVAVAAPFLLGAITNVQCTHYADTGWNGVHAGPRNDDYARVDVGRAFRHAWRASDGNSFEMAPTIALDRQTILLARGQGPGGSNLQALDLDGNLVWEVAPWTDASGFDSCAAMSSPIVDRQGDIYVGDCNQLWAFYPDGATKWVIDLPLPPADAPFQDITAAPVNNLVNAFFTKDGSVGGITLFGDIVIVSRHDGSLRAPVLTLPGIAGGTPEEAPMGLFEGSIDPELIPVMWNWIFATETFVSADTPAISIKTGRIFISARGSTGKNSLWGVDFKPRRNGLGTLTVAFEADLDNAGGSSPALSPDESVVYAGSQIGNVKAFTTDTGQELWSTSIGSGAGSVAVGPDGRIFAVAGNGTALNPDGSIAWAADLLFLTEGLPTSDMLGEPQTAVTSILTIGGDAVIISAQAGYDLTNIFPARFNLPVTVFLVTLDRRTGEVIEGSVPYRLRTSVENLSVPLTNGKVLVAYGALLASAAAPFKDALAPLLPPGVSAVDPDAGLEAIEAIDEITIGRRLARGKRLDGVVDRGDFTVQIGAPHGHQAVGGWASVGTARIDVNIERKGRRYEGAIVVRDWVKGEAALLIVDQRNIDSPLGPHAVQGRSFAYVLRDGEIIETTLRWRIKDWSDE